MKTKQQLIKNNKEEKYLTREEFEEILDQWMMDNEEKMTQNIIDGVNKIIRENKAYSEEAKAATEELFERELNQPWYWISK